MRRFVAGSAVALLMVGFVLVASADAIGGSVPARTPVIDQEQSVIDLDAGFMYAVKTQPGDDSILAQVVTPGLTGLLTEIRLAGTCQTALNLDVQGVTGGVPNGVVLGSQTVSFPGPSTTFRGVVFSTPISVTAGVPYAVVLTTSGSCGIWPGPVGNPYPGGDALFLSSEGLGWLPLSIGYGRSDLPFQTLVTPGKSTEPPASGGQCNGDDRGEAQHGGNDDRGEAQHGKNDDHGKAQHGKNDNRRDSRHGRKHDG